MEKNHRAPSFLKKSNTILLIVLFTLILLLDQWLKIWVKLNFHLGEQQLIFGLNWARLHFVENEGMAFGLLLGESNGKAALTVLRLLSVIFISWLLFRFFKEKKYFGLQLCLVLILAGAMGNLLDSLFYGILFSASPFHGGMAEWMPEGGGYAPLFMGKVVDMLYFPLIDTHWPEWIPAIGGNRLQLIKSVFNLADVSVVTGTAGLIILFRKW